MQISFLSTLKSSVSNSFPQLKESIKESLDASGLFDSSSDNGGGSDDSSESDDD